MKKGAYGWVNRLVQEKLDLMAGAGHQAELDRARNPKLGHTRPGLHEHGAAVYIEARLLDAYVLAWLGNHVPERTCSVETKLRPSADTEISVTVRGLEESDTGRFLPLEPNGPWRIIGGRKTLLADAMKRLLAEMLGWPEAAKLIANKDGVVLLPPEL